MVDYVSFFNTLVGLLNNNKSCGFCWVYAAPLSEQTGNVQQDEKDDECCVHVIVTDISDSIRRQYDINGYYKAETRTTNVTLDLMIEDDFWRNNYDEINGYPVSESRWEKYLRKMRACFDLCKVDQFCNLIGLPVQLEGMQANIRPDPNTYDRNFIGWRMTFTFTEKLDIDRDCTLDTTGLDMDNINENAFIL